jgi:hypothetical protein
MIGQRVVVALWAMAVFDAGQKLFLKKYRELKSCKNGRQAGIIIQRATIMRARRNLQKKTGRGTPRILSSRFSSCCLSSML